MSMSNLIWININEVIIKMKVIIKKGVKFLLGKNKDSLTWK
jgi:hypothetical protein